MLRCPKNALRDGLVVIKDKQSNSKSIKVNSINFCQALSGIEGEIKLALDKILNEYNWHCFVHVEPDLSQSQFSGKQIMICAMNKKNTPRKDWWISVED